MPKELTQRELLVRLDERSINSYNLQEKTEKHLSDLNGTVADILERQTIVETTVYGKGSDMGLVGFAFGLGKMQRRIVIGLVSTISTLVGLGILDASILHIIFK